MTHHWPRIARPNVGFRGTAPDQGFRDEIPNVLNRLTFPAGSAILAILHERLERDRLPYIRRLFILCLALLCIPPHAKAEPYEHPYPEALQIRVETGVWPSETLGDISVSVPVTTVESVNQALREAAEALLPQMETYAGCRIDTLSTYRVSGTKWAGFLLTARAVTLRQAGAFAVEDTEALYFDVRTYDMETGEALTLADVFAPGSSAWAKIAGAARAMLADYYPGETRDTIALDAMTEPEALRALPFLPCAGRLMVPFALRGILQNHPQIAWLSLPYPDYRALMRPQAMLQSDNSTRPIVALTFDDGPARPYTQQVLEGLAGYGACATFFCVGASVKSQPDFLRREMDLGSTAAAHSMTHAYPWEQTAAEMRGEYEAQRRLFQEETGLPATLLRPPGGYMQTYIARQVGWPLIRWNKSGSDTGHLGARGIAGHVIASVAHGDIVLMHDTKQKTADAVPLILEGLIKRGYMFATVDELLYLSGVTPEPNVGYLDGLGTTCAPDK